MAKATTATKPAAKPAAKPAKARPPARKPAPPPLATTSNAPGIITLPLNQLVLSQINVRKTERDADVASLAEDIAARGLKQNLVVVPGHFSTILLDKYPKDCFEVIAGGRRFQAMQMLVADGRLPADTEVPCLVEPRAEAAETSLSENLHRVAMNPADEFDAFAAIVAAQRKLGSSEADAIAHTAKRFGVTIKHVEGRLRLATLAPEILEALRKGAITLDAAKAYAGSTDHELQRKVFLDQNRPGAFRPGDPATIRKALRDITLPLDHPLVKYVGLEAYRAAKGRTEVELFMGTDGEERIVDVALIEDMATARAEADLVGYRGGSGWRSAVLARGTGPYAAWPKTPDGFVKCWSDPEDMEPEERARNIAVVAIDSEGAGLTCIGSYRPDEKKPVANTNKWQPETPEQRAARAREEGISLWQARMAVGDVDYRADEGKVSWPDGRWVNRVTWIYPEGDEAEERDDEDRAPVAAYVAVLVRVDITEIDAQRAAAEARYDEDQAAIAKASATRDEPIQDDEEAQP